MCNSVNPLQVSSFSAFSAQQRPILAQDSRVDEIALPVITTLGNQTRVDGDRAYAVCFAGITAAVAAGTLTPAGIILAAEACLPLAWNPPLSC